MGVNFVLGTQGVNLVFATPGVNHGGQFCFLGRPSFLEFWEHPKVGERFCIFSFKGRPDLNQ